MILVADIGGTRARLAVYERGEHGWRQMARHEYASQSYASFDAVLKQFLLDASLANSSMTAVCLALAGPVTSDRVRLTNVPWHIDRQHLSDVFERADSVSLLNDFAAVAYGVTQLPASALQCLHAGDAHVQGPRLVLGAGTGMGQALLLGQQAPFQVLATEAGHSDFAPSVAWQEALLHFWRQRLDRVSVESLISGSGLVRIYEYLLQHEGQHESAAVASALTQGEDAAAVISHAALQQHDPLALRAVDGLVELYGAYAGNAALQCGARGGVIIAGGVALKLRERLRQGGFVRAFSEKPPMQAYLAGIPLLLVLDPDVGLLGAAQYAWQQSGGGA